MGMIQDTSSKAMLLPASHCHTSCQHLSNGPALEDNPAHICPSSVEDTRASRSLHCPFLIGLGKESKSVSHTHFAHCNTPSAGTHGTLQRLAHSRSCQCRTTLWQKSLAKSASSKTENLPHTHVHICIHIHIKQASKQS